MVGSFGGTPLVPPSQPTQAPLRVCMTGRSAVTSPPGDNSQPSAPRRIGSVFATATTGRPEPRASGCIVSLDGTPNDSR